MRFNKLLFTFLLIAFVSCSKESVNPPDPVIPPPVGNADTTFSNPLLSSGPDPWVIQKDSFYYYTHTSGDRIRLWKTKNMSRLNVAPSVTVWIKPVTGPNSENVWAPELHYFDGKWYIYYTAGSNPDNTVAQRLFVLENSSPDPTQGTWVDKGRIFDPAADFWAIDATVYEDNGNRYMVWSGHASNTDMTQRLYIARMQNPWTLATPRTLISSPTFAWEKIGSGGVFPEVNEGPQIIKNAAGKTFLVFSSSGCWTDDYNMGMMSLITGGNPLNPTDWVKLSNPVFTTSTTNNAYGPGHCSFFKSVDNSENWLLYHANAAPNQGCGDLRSPRMQEFAFAADGVPNFGVPVKTGLLLRRPSGER